MLQPEPFRSTLNFRFPHSAREMSPPSSAQRSFSELPNRLSGVALSSDRATGHLQDPQERGPPPRQGGRGQTTAPLCSITRHEEPAATTDFKTKMQTEEAQRIYAIRSCIAEFPHAWIKEKCRLRQFRCRGRVKATMEATWACLSYNLARWFSIRQRRNQASLATA